MAKPKASAKKPVDEPGVLYVKAPKWLIEALDQRTDVLRDKDPLHRHVTRQALVLDVLASAVENWKGEAQ